MKLLNKVAVVTGGASGIGMEICKAFAAEGAKVIAADMGAMTYRMPKRRQYLPLNVADVRRRARRSSIKSSPTYGRIDILVNNAGITPRRDDPQDDRRHVGRRHQRQPQRRLQPHPPSSARKWKSIGGGSIINISSVVGLFGNIGQANYAATKAGVIGLTMTWAKEFARKGVPGPRQRDRAGLCHDRHPQDRSRKNLLKEFAKMTMLNRLGQPEEIAKVALFLASDDASYITGQTISVNGGMRL
ncbi:MAG: SDR family oxidoreductase [Bacillus subtilis]|nr:SDR family oxidoreductase [Bacillus subtilis]